MKSARYLPADGLAFAAAGLVIGPGYGPGLVQRQSDLWLAVIGAARKKATEMGVAMNIAVVDDGGNLVAFARMDGAWLGSIEIAQDKAWTAPDPVRCFQ